MKKFKLSDLDKIAIEKRLANKYKKIGSLDLRGVKVYQLETVNEDVITTVKIEYGFITINTITFIYNNDELFNVTGIDVSMKLIEEMKDLLKENNK